ncbi:MAG TPA: 3'(2'),5'-bisphosphate nucleotidase CysQ [Gemmatimonadaceae bacterium]
MVDGTPLLSDVRAIARKAGAAIMRYYGDSAAPIDVGAKADMSPITAADRDAHRIIVQGLGSLDDTIPVISEEGKIPSYAERRDWTTFWLVDPLDGTKEFISRNGEFTVNIALVERGEPVLGVILAPALDVLYFAQRGTGSWREDSAASPVRIFSNDAMPGATCTVVESRSHPSPELEAFLGTIRVGTRVAAGSSLKFCWVAEGTADLYPRLGPTMEWDVAAGDCIYRNAGRGGPNPSPLSYNKPDLRNESFVIGRPWTFTTTSTGPD